MKKLVRIFSLCALFVIVCSLSFLMVACKDKAPIISGRYMDDNNNFYQISKKDGKYSIMRVLRAGHEIKHFNNFGEIDKNGHYWWHEMEPLSYNSKAPYVAFEIEIYSVTNEETGEVFLYVIDSTLDNSYHRQTKLTPTQMQFSEWQITY